MPFQYNIPEYLVDFFKIFFIFRISLCLYYFWIVLCYFFQDRKTIVASLISFLGVIFIACISIFFINLFNQKIEIIMLVSFSVLMIIFFFVSFGVANLFTETPNLALVKSILIYSLSGLIMVIVVEYSSELPRNTGSLVLIGVICLLFVFMTIYSTLSAETKQVKDIFHFSKTERSFGLFT